jgi:8-oxo-dGTP diphosphatase
VAGEPHVPGRRPLVGVGVFVLDGDRILLGKRRGSHGAGTWALPGGHLEWGETVEACARREVLEETGLEIADVRPGPFTNDVFPEGRHYVTLFVVARRAGGTLALLEPAKCERWETFAWEALPDPLFRPLATLRATGFDPRRA